MPARHVLASRHQLCCKSTTRPGQQGSGLPAGCQVSPSKQLMAYAVDTQGGEKYDIQVRDLRSGKDLLPKSIKVGYVLPSARLPLSHRTWALSTASCSAWHACRAVQALLLVFRQVSAVSSSAASCGCTALSEVPGSSPGRGSDDAPPPSCLVCTPCITMLSCAASCTRSLDQVAESALSQGACSQNTSGNVIWAKDSRTLLYVTKQDKILRPYKVWRHEIGSDPEADQAVFQEDDEAYNVGISKSRDGDWLLISTGEGFESISCWQYKHEAEGMAGSCVRCVLVQCWELLLERSCVLHAQGPQSGPGEQYCMLAVPRTAPGLRHSARVGMCSGLAAAPPAAPEKQALGLGHSHVHGAVRVQTSRPGRPAHAAPKPVHLPAKHAPVSDVPICMLALSCRPHIAATTGPQWQPACCCTAQPGWL